MRCGFFCAKYANIGTKISLVLVKIIHKIKPQFYEYGFLKQGFRQPESQIMNHLQKLQQLLTQGHYDACIIPTADPHLSEYLPEHWAVRSWLSGFTGSAGTLVVSVNDAALWTDSRYWEQASAQLSGSQIALKKQGIDEEITEWLQQNLPQNAKIAIAPDMISRSGLQHFQAACKDFSWHFVDLSNEIWTTRPALPTEKIYAHHADFIGMSAQNKIAQIRQSMQTQHADHHLISSLDDIAWLTNLRGNDVPYNPVFLAYILISPDATRLFVDKQKLDDATCQLLNAAQIECLDYHTIVDYVATLSGSLLIDPNKTAVSTLAKSSGSLKIIENINPTTLAKSQKNHIEIKHIRETMRYDGVALCGFFAELESRLALGEIITEYDIDGMLLHHRSLQPHFVSPSFDTIAAYNAHAAMPHYSAPQSGSSTLTGDGVLLIDSGGQYHGGTTDITRVIPIGTPSVEQKKDFTLVLKAHIALAQAVFPENTPAAVLDGICRAPLWRAQCEFGHGTGHGVGYFLNVHEGPQSISYRAKVTPHTAMKVGMLTSNEPGLYRPNRWGIRIENLVINQTVMQPKETEFGHFLCLETVTLCPIDTRLILVDLLEAHERTWLNAYHTQVRTALLPLVANEARDWLLARTEHIETNC